MRALNQVLSLLLGIVLLAGGLLLAVEAVLAATGQTSWLVPADAWYRSLTENRVGDRAVLFTAIAVALLGLIILVAEVRPLPPVRLPVHLDKADGDWWVARRGAQRRLAGAAENVSGVTGASAKVRARGGRWKVAVRAEAREGSRQAVEQAVEEALARLGSPRDSEVSVRLARPRRVS